MRAFAVKPGEKTLGTLDQPDPGAPARGQVRVEPLDVGICGTDKEICHFQYGTPPQGSDYLIIGHEALARVADIGDGVSGLRPGQLVVPMVRRPSRAGHGQCRA